MKKGLSGWLALLAVIVIACGGCDGPGEKKAKFFARGRALYQKADYVRAGLEFKNALQIDPKFAQACSMLGQTALMQGDLTGARASLARAVELAPNDVSTRLLLGNVLLAGNALGEAFEQASIVLRAQPLNEAALLLKAGVLLRQAKPGDALRVLDGMRARKPKAPGAYLMAALAHDRQKDPVKAEQALLQGLAASPGSVEVLQELADRYASAGRAAQAEPLLRKIVAMQPGNVRNRISLAALYWGSNRRGEAAGELESLLAKSAGNEESWRSVSSFYHARGFPAVADRTLRDGIAANPKSMRLRLALAWFYLETGKPDRGAALLKEALASEKNRRSALAVQAKGALSGALLAQGNADEALSVVNEALEETPKSSELHFTKGKILLSKGDGTGAVAELRTVVSESPHFVPGHLALAEAHKLNREYGLALGALRTPLRDNPDSMELLSALAGEYLARNDLPSARGTLKKIVGIYGERVRQNPRDAAAWNMLGKLHASGREFEQARAEFEKAGELQPEWAAPAVNLARVYLAEGRKDEAVKKCELSMKKMPRAPMPYLLLGQVFEQTGEFRKAMGVYTRALEQMPDLWVAANNLAFALSEHPSCSADLDVALSCARRARQIMPQEPALTDTLGWVHYKRGELVQALAQARAAVAANPENPIHTCHLGMILAGMGRKAEAKVRLTAALAGKDPFPGREEAEKVLKDLGRQPVMQ